MDDAQTTMPRRYGRIVDAARWSGLSPSTLRRWLAEGRLDSHRPPGTRLVLVDLEQLAEVIRGGPTTA